MNYLGPNSGLQVYFNGTEVPTTYANRFEYNNTAGHGRILMGKIDPDSSIYKVSMKVDEIILFNKALNNTDIQLLYNTTQI